MNINWTTNDLKTWRTSNRLNQEQAAVMLGIKRKAYNQMENGHTPIERRTVLSCGYFSNLIFAVAVKPRKNTGFGGFNFVARTVTQPYFESLGKTENDAINAAMKQLGDYFYDCLDDNTKGPDYSPTPPASANVPIYYRPIMPYVGKGLSEDEISTQHTSALGYALRAISPVDP